MYHKAEKSPSPLNHFRFMFTIYIYFPLFLGMAMYDSEFKTKENKI